jgi:hypothetical protein
MKSVFIKVSSEDSTNLESLYYEVEARRSLLQTEMSSGDFSDINFKKSFDFYHNEYVKFMRDYDVAKSNMEKKYIKSDHRFDGKSVTWTFHFSEEGFDAVYEETK